MTLSSNDYASEQLIRWCPGCGDFSIIKALRTALSTVGRPVDQTAIISGIGCSSRLPYYMSTYGFHTIHGRAPAIATGLKVAQPNVDVWVVSGDGDCLSIGTNHFVHTLRRNVDIQYLLLNNEIYGLTKGQTSPTSPLGTHSPSTPNGSMIRPVNALNLALSAGGTFVARSMDMLQNHILQTLLSSHEHSGTGFVEILQNCSIYNNGAYKTLIDKKTKNDNQIFVQHGKALLFGDDNSKGLIFNPKSLKLQIVSMKDYSIQDIVIHDETNITLAYLLASMSLPDFPIAMGIIYRSNSPAFNPVTMINKTPAELLSNFHEFLESTFSWKVA